MVQGGLGQGGVHAVQVAGVRHDDDHAAARGGRGGGGHGDLGRPFGRTGQRRPGGPDRAALGQAGQERRPGGIAAPGAGVRRGRRRGRRRGPGLRGFPFGGGVPRRDGQPEHVGERARVPVGHRPGQVEDLRGEHGLGRGHPLQPGQLALVLARLGAFQQVTVDQLAGEPDPDPAAGHGLGVQAGRDEVVEGTVEVGQRDVHGHPGDGQPLAHRLVLRPLRHGSVLPEPRQRLRQRQGEVAAAEAEPESRRPADAGSRERVRTCGCGGGQTPTASRSWSARSVRSQEKSGSVRPKCPYAAVCA